jgi:hypothetical protein
MRAKLRTWIRSWRVWVIVACLAYIGGLHWRGPANAAMGPPWVWITKGLVVVALLVLTWFVLKYLAFPWFMYFYGEGEKKGGRTDKAKEKLADSLMSFSTAVGSTLLISVLVVPFTAFIQAIARDVDPVEMVVSRWPPAWWSGWHTAVFLFLLFVPIFISLLARRQALDLYDEIAPPSLPPTAPAVGVTVGETQERASIRDHVPPAHASADGRTRHRRRPRAK